MIGNFLQNIHFNGKNYNGNNGDKGKISYRFAEQLGLSIYHRAVKTGLSVGVDALVRLPDEVFSKLLYKQLKNLRYQESTKFMMKLARELKRRYSQFHPNVRRRFVENLFGNEMLLSDKKHQRVADKLGDWPVTMVVSPTMRCNLTCEGCYSAHYHRKDGMDTETFDRVLTQAKEMGIYFVVISGGEPFIRKDLLEIFRRHQDMLFMTYTNGIIIHDRNLAPRLAELGNVLPTISVEGFEDETNKRRGKGVYNKVIGAMNQLRDHGVIFGFSATPMRHNSDLLVTDEFVEFYEKLGAFFGWYFSYMPVGRNPDLSLMPTVEQRLRRYSRIRELREKYRVVMADFWCDGGLSGGCLFM